MIPSFPGCDTVHLVGNQVDCRDREAGESESTDRRVPIGRRSKAPS